MSLISPMAMDSADVKMISMHHPATPHFIKFFQNSNCFSVFSMCIVWQNGTWDMHGKIQSLYILISVFLIPVINGCQGSVDFFF